jgi:hypothetical protein
LEFVHDGTKVSQRANGLECRRISRTRDAAERTKKQGRFDSILGGWRGSPIDTMARGLPVNLNYGPRLLGDPMAPIDRRNIDNYFNKANAVIPVYPLHPNPFGDAGRNTVRSYAFCQPDLGLHKEFPPWKEGKRIQFRGTGRAVPPA